MIEFKPIPERFFRDPYSALLEHDRKRTGADQIPDLDFRDSKQITNIIDLKCRLIGFFHNQITFHFHSVAVIYSCKRSMFVLILQSQTALLFGCILSTAWIGASDHAVLFVFRWFLKRGSTHGSKPRTIWNRGIQLSRCRWTNTEAVLVVSLHPCPDYTTVNRICQPVNRIFYSFFSTFFRADIRLTSAQFQCYH